jgi:N-acetylglucosaminyldiphosphoundecaprenol N-acetyl-beta-D-mannosaminyltransferase
MGLPVHGFTRGALADHLIAESRDGRGGYVMTPNLDNLRAISKNPDVLSLALAADIRVPDGMPLIWASRIKRTALPERVPGSSLVVDLIARMRDADRTLFLLGGEPGVADRARAALLGRHPGLEIVGTYCPPHGFEHDPEELTRVLAAVKLANPDFVYVGLPFPKAADLVNRLRDVLPNTWFLGVGISLSFICGEVRRAPSWMQATGLEWLFRLKQEPRRLARRYLVEGLPFAACLLGKSVVERLHRPRSRRQTS